MLSDCVVFMAKHRFVDKLGLCEKWKGRILHADVVESSDAVEVGARSFDCGEKEEKLLEKSEKLCCDRKTIIEALKGSKFQLSFCQHPHNTHSLVCNNFHTCPRCHPKLSVSR